MGLKRNAIWNIAEVLFASLVLFVLYRLILKALGLEALGIWSLVLATTSFARIADLGAAGGLGRYVALSQARKDGGDAALVYVESALILNVALYAILGVLLYWPAQWAINAFTHGPATADAQALLPYAIAAFALQNVTGVVTAALIGFHRSYQKSMLTLVTLAVQAGVALATVEALGLRGVALAQVAQWALLLCAGWFLVVRAASGRWRFALPWRIRREPLRELVGFGLRLQALNIVSFPFEPMVKFVFSSVGGLAALGMYELASRGILQVRQVVVAPSQNLTPLFTQAHHEGNEALAAHYRPALVSIALAATLAMGATAVGSPVISYIWLREIDLLFIAYSLILSAGWFVNIIATPGYYLGIAAGRLRWNIIGSVVSTVLGPMLGYLLGLEFGGLGIAAGAMAAIAAAALIIWFYNCKSLEIAPAPEKADWARPAGVIVKFTNRARP